MQNRLIQRLIFDLVFGAILFLPLITILFLWQVFFQRPSVNPTDHPSMPKFNDVLFQEIKNKSDNRSHASEPRLIDIRSTEYEPADPFGP